MWDWFGRADIEKGAQQQPLFTVIVGNITMLFLRKKGAQITERVFLFKRRQKSGSDN
jgi:hypothetical protein